ncbi:hypothetical protein Meth11DRAFT_2002 [Methylophilaceae bacterium 11]|nr:hypothetical protein Meth11DRAFT_2002 [Methylophilaceae bacterium 11]
MKVEAEYFLPYLKNNICELELKCIPLWHPLGFVSCIIHEVSNLFTVRIHYWPENVRRVKNPDWPIHTHSYFLSSHILNGELTDIQYEQYEAEEYSIFSVNYYKGGSEIHLTNKKTGVKETIHTRRLGGESYSVSKGVFHQTNVEIDKTALTLVALSEFSEEPPLVLGNSVAQNSYPYDRVIFEPEIFWREVKIGLNLKYSL